jgi:hypothetical protein
MGRMNVQLRLHGGVRGLLSVIDEGLVERNARAIRTGEAPPLSQVSGIQYVAQPNWFDAPTAARMKIVSAGTLAAWRAGELRAKYDDPGVRVALVGGVPKVIVPGQSPEDPSVKYGRLPGAVQPIVGGSSNPDEGVVTEYLSLTIDGNEALPVREIGDAIAAHNARRMRVRAAEGRPLPRLYESEIRYQTEGNPEKWWDAEEIEAQGFDDCEGLAAYRAGELRLAGIPAWVWTRPIIPDGQGGTRLFHALVKADTPEGPRFDDPSIRVKDPMPIPRWYYDQAKRKRAVGQPI